MKKRILFSRLMIIILAAMGFHSCSPDYETNFEVKSLYIKHRDLSPVKFEVDGGNKDIPVETNIPVENWSASSNAEWCIVDKESNKVKISAAKSELYITRVARVTIAYGHQSYDVLVSQNGTAPILLIEGEREGVVKEAGVDGGSFTVDVESNLVIDYVNIPEVASWLELVSITGTGNIKTLTFNVAPNYNVSVRETEITLQSLDNFTYLSSFNVRQAERDWGVLSPIPVDLRLDMLSANASEPNDGGGLAALIDNNISTFYHTLWSGVSPGGKPHYVQIDLDEPLSFIAVEYHGRGGGNAPGDVKRAGIWVSETGNNVDSEWTKVTSVTYDMDTPKNELYKMNEQVVYLEGEYKHIRFVPEARRNADPIDSSGTVGWWNMSNFYLYTFDL